jgi:nucleotide-binding universal stress UspA family protein
VPVDLSAASNEALLFAAQLAKWSSLPLVILHVVHDDVHRPNIYPRRNEKEQMLPIDEIAESMLQNFFIWSVYCPRFLVVFSTFRNIPNRKNT